MPKGLTSPTVVDLFSGAGGFSLGFHAAGCRIIGAVDIDESAGRSFAENFGRLQPEAPPVVLAGDEANLEEVDLSRIVDQPVDILIGGPPCQGFSRAGRAKLDSLSDEGFAEDPRNHLYKRFLDAVELWHPRAVVMENVPGMLSVKGRNVADDAAGELVARGYRVGYALLNAVWYGVPQFRERVFFIGIRKELRVDPSMPPMTHEAALPIGYSRAASSVNLSLSFVEHLDLQVPAAGIRVPATTVGEALSDLPVLFDHLQQVTRPRGDFRIRRDYRCAPEGPYARLMRKWPGMKDSADVDDHSARKTPRDYEIFRRMKPGDRYPDALKIARAIRDEELARLAKAGRAPEAGTPEFRELEMRFVPPYPEDMFVDKWRKLTSSLPSWTIPAHLAKDAYSHIHFDSSQARSVTVREAARLQSFPDSFRFEGNMGDCFRQIGNAVPPLLSWAVAGQVLHKLGVEHVRPPWQS